MQDAYTAGDIAGALGIDSSNIHRRARKESWPVLRVSRGVAGAPLRVFPFATLPADVQDALKRHEREKAAKAALIEHPESGNRAHALACGPLPAMMVPKRGRMVEIAPNAQPPEPYNQRGLDRYTIVQLYLEQVRKVDYGARGEAAKKFVGVYNCGLFLPEISSRIPTISEQSLYRWDRLLRENDDNYYALCDFRGFWKEGRYKQLGQIGPECEAAILRCYLQPGRPTVNSAYRTALVILKQQGVEKIPSYSSFARYLERFASWRKDIVTLAREGEKALKDSLIAYITRDDSILEVGDVLVADGHDLNFTILHPETGKAARLKLVMFFDWASRMPVGWCILPTEDTVAVSSALYEAIHCLGKFPRAVLLDNGKAFKSKVFNEKTDLREEQGLYTRLGIECHYAAPYNARSKVIERWFGTFNNQCERLMPTYTGASIEDKPAWMNRNERFHKWWQASKVGGYVPTIREASDLIALYINWYALQPHGGLNGATPAEIFEAGRGPGVDTDALRWQFLWTKKVRPRRSRVTLYGIQYESDCLYGLDQEILLKYSTSSMLEIWCYTLEGQYLGEAKPVEALSPMAKLFGDEVGLSKIKDQLRRQRRQAKHTKDGLKEIFGPEMASIMNFAPRQAILAPKALAEAEATTEAVQALAALPEIEPTQEDAGPPPCPERPEYFFNDIDRYDWCFRAEQVHLVRISAEDSEFSAEFEQTKAFHDDYNGRYALLRELYSKKKLAA